jgi:hypothetical protein
MSGAAPLRFLGLVLGGWVAARAALLAPGLWPAMATAPAPKITPRFLDSAAASPAYPHRPDALMRVEPAKPASAESTLIKLAGAVEERSEAARPTDFAGLVSPVLSSIAAVERPRPGEASASPLPLPNIAAPPLGLPGRWSVSAWTLVRRGEGRQLAPGGTLGGSQAGARMTYRLRDRLFLSGRFYTPLNDSAGAEAALGVEWQPLRTLPVRLLAERRQAVGRDGRSAFALLAHGGVSEQPLVGPVMLDAYVQAGMVGLKSRDGFADGAARLAVPVAGDVSVGLGAWGAVQPGVSRLDVGPHASYRLPAFGDRIRVSAEWRVRVAGDARPGSGPALTLSTDF